MRKYFAMVVKEHSPEIVFAGELEAADFEAATRSCYGFARMNLAHEGTDPQTPVRITHLVEQTDLTRDVVRRKRLDLQEVAA